MATSADIIKAKAEGDDITRTYQVTVSLTVTFEVEAEDEYSAEQAAWDEWDGNLENADATDVSIDQDLTSTYLENELNRTLRGLDIAAENARRFRRHHHPLAMATLKDIKAALVAEYEKAVRILNDEEDDE